jgi:hypothetical protein
MRTRFLLAVCLSLIVGSVFVAPETVKLGVSTAIALDLSRVLLVMGFIAAVLTINAEAREYREDQE